MILLRLFYEFFKVGLFSIGGGLATLPFLYDISDKTGWFTHADITNLIAISESTPGPIGVNAATYVGFLTDGLAGAVTATIGLIAPSIVIIILISRVLERFRDSRLVDDLFYGLRPASTGLIAAAGLLVVKSTFFVPGAANFAAYFRLPPALSGNPALRRHQKMEQTPDFLYCRFRCGRRSVPPCRVIKKPSQRKAF